MSHCMAGCCNQRTTHSWFWISLWWHVLVQRVFDGVSRCCLGFVSCMLVNALLGCLVFSMALLLMFCRSPWWKRWCCGHSSPSWLRCWEPSLLNKGLFRYRWLLVVSGTDPQNLWDLQSRSGWWVCCCFAVDVHLICHVLVCRWDTMICKACGQGCAAWSVILSVALALMSILPWWLVDCPLHLPQVAHDNFSSKLVDPVH